jgi:hypothetical protein
MVSTDQSSQHYVHQQINLYFFPVFQVFISVSVILGDGLYNLIKIIYATIKEIMNARAKQGRLPLVRVQDGNVIFLCYASYLSINIARSYAAFLNR